MLRPEPLHLRPGRRAAARSLVLAVLLACGVGAALLIGRPGGAPSLSTALADDAARRAPATCSAAGPTARPAPVAKDGDEADAAEGQAEPAPPRSRPEHSAEAQPEPSGKAHPEPSPDADTAAPAGGDTDTDTDEAGGHAHPARPDRDGVCARTPLRVSTASPLPVQPAAAPPRPAPAAVPVTIPAAPPPASVPVTVGQPAVAEAPRGVLPVVGAVPTVRVLPVVGPGSSPAQGGGGSGQATTSAPAAVATPAPPPAVRPRPGPASSATPAPSTRLPLLPIPPGGPLAPLSVPAPHVDLGPSSLTLWLAFSTIGAVALVFGARLLLRSR